MILSGVKNFCDEAIKNGKIFFYSDKDISVPSFKLNDDIQKNELYKAVSEKLEICLDINDFNINKVFGKKLTIDDFLKAQIALENDNETTEQKLLNKWAEKIPAYLEKHPDFNYTELNKSTLMHSITSRVLDSTNDVHSLSLDAAFGEDTSTYLVKKDKLAASLILLKEQIPSVSKNVDIILKDYPDQSFISQVKSLVEKPEISVVKHIQDYSKKTAEKLYPQQVKTLNMYSNSSLTC